MPEAGFALVNLENQDSFVFQFFPNETRSTDRTNWNAQETTIGIKPLFYANREPRLIEVQELYLDSTETNESLTLEIKKLRTLMEEIDGKGTPPKLLAIWGDQNQRCVLQDLTIENVFFNDLGEPTRIRVGLSLLEVQPDSGASTDVRVLDE